MLNTYLNLSSQCPPIAISTIVFVIVSFLVWNFVLLHFFKEYFVVMFRVFFNHQKRDILGQFHYMSIPDCWTQPNSKMMFLFWQLTSSFKIVTIYCEIPLGMLTTDAPTENWKNKQWLVPKINNPYLATALIGTKCLQRPPAYEL